MLDFLFGRTAKTEAVSAKARPRAVSLHVTLWPGFDHFPKFAVRPGIDGIRLNPAMMSASEIDGKFEHRVRRASVPLWFDVKGMQMRIKEVVKDHRHDHLEFILNRPVQVKTPCPVYFKAGEDAAKLVEIRDGTHFIFEGGPRFEVRAGESIHIRKDDVEVGGPLILDFEQEKIDRIKRLGFNRWYLSYVYRQRDVDEFREIIGPDAELILKIENQWGLNYVANEYKPTPNTRLMAARGDLYVEVPYPHQILNACKLIISKDPDAFVGSRMLLSIFTDKHGVPSCADFSELAWLYDTGFRNFLLCDELCLKDELLSGATNAFAAFKQEYCEVYGK